MTIATVVVTIPQRNAGEIGQCPRRATRLQAAGWAKIAWNSEFDRLQPPVNGASRKVYRWRDRLFTPLIASQRRAMYSKASGEGREGLTLGLADCGKSGGGHASNPP